MLIPKKPYFPCMLWLLVASSCTSSILVRPVAAAQAHGPLYADSRWIVDGAGQRVKLACVNWPSHLQPVVAEGLDKQPVDEIMKKIKSMGFNCVRFTWPVELATNDTLSSLTIGQSFTGLGLTKALTGLKANNPWAANLTLADAFKAMLASFQRNGVMIILDNHLTVPGWCCGLNDGQGFFGDRFFDPDLWMKGLSKMATVATKFPNVIGMSLRNELRGPKSNVDDWYKYMQRGAETVHAVNPNVLVILSGLNYDKDLSFLQTRPVNVSFTRKIVFELHWYSFSNSGSWTGGNLNDACGWISGNIMGQAGFLADKGQAPLFVSEFGVNGHGDNPSDNRYISCFMAVAADQDWDFAVWTLQGSYYLREGAVGMEELYGLLDYNWTDVRNSTILKRLSSLQIPFRGPGSQQPPSGKILYLYHPLTGLCAVKGLNNGTVQLGPCPEAEVWNYTPQEALRLRATESFLWAVGAGKAVKLGQASQWNPISNSKLHLSAKAVDNTTVCLDVGAGGGNQLVTNACKCLKDDKSCDPTSQWFKLVETTTRA